MIIIPWIGPDISKKEIDTIKKKSNSNLEIKILSNVINNSMLIYKCWNKSKTIIFKHFFCDIFKSNNYNFTKQIKAIRNI